MLTVSKAYDHSVNLFSRQENDLEISLAAFPKTDFETSQEFVKVFKKLYWSCQNETMTRFGYKRRGLDTSFPGLCAYYDDYIYNSMDLSQLVVEGLQSSALGNYPKILNCNFFRRPSNFGTFCKCEWKYWF